MFPSRGTLLACQSTNPPRSAPISTELDQLLEGVLFADPDPRVQRLKGIWDEARNEAFTLFDRAKAEQLEEQIRYHHICQNPDGESVAKAEASALTQLLIEERDQRLDTIWKDITRRVNAVLEDLREE